MATRRKQVEEIGGFEALKDCLADDYQLGNRIAGKGYRISLSSVTVECWSAPMSWPQVWKHQLRWARTIRVCQPLPYFFSILSNPTLWPLLWLLAYPTRFALGASCGFWFIRCLTAANLQRRLIRARVRPGLILLPLLKDLLQAAIWLLAFAGNRIEWRGEKMKLKRDGTLVRN